MKFLTFVLLSFLTLGANEQPKQKVLQLKQEFTLKVGQKVTAEKALSIEFSSVAEDSRCPRGVTCIWEGNGKIVLKVTKPGNHPATLELNTNLNPKTGRYLGYQLMLKNLVPYPDSSSKICASDYVATLTLQKL